ncbi:MAG: hypothetical protein EXS05_16205 [Planctomycetaceae bacterium]|nr:hypothetical protein [Planctomycetaceae bacterium]
MFSRCRVVGRIFPAWAAVLLGGCLNLSSQSRTAWRGLDPLGPLGAQDPIATPAAPELTLRPNSPASTPDETLDDREATKILPRQSPKGLPQFPRIEIDDLVKTGEVELVIDAPRRKQVASHVTYRISVRNNSDKTVDDVTLRCQFDEPLVFGDIGQRSVRQTFSRLLPGESKDLSLSLYCDKVGAACCRFSITTGSDDNPQERVSQSVCVEFVDRQLSIDLLGPTQRSEGTRAEYNVTLTNFSSRTLTDVRAVLAHDQALVLQAASAGAKTRSGQIHWKLGTLQPMESVVLQVEFQCRSLARRACVSLQVQTAELAPEEDEACLEIVPVPGTLELSVSDRDDPLDVGRRGVYEVTIRNLGLQPARRIALAAELPAQLKFVGARLREGDDELAVGVQQDDGRLIFDVVEDLAADGSLTYLIEVEPTSAGTIEFRVNLTSALTSVPVTAAEPTTIAEP